MKIEINKIPLFCLTCEKEQPITVPRRVTKRYLVQLEFCGMHNGKGPTFINPIYDGTIPKNKSGASGFIRMIENGLMLQTPGEPFKPFMMIEDDASFYMRRDSVIVPDNTDILYIGLSSCSIDKETFHYQNYFESVENYPDIVRIKNMLASHGIMVCSALGAAALQRAMMETWFTDMAWDMPMARMQPFYNVYALRKPLVFQNEYKGGDYLCTAITLDKEDCPLPDEYIHYELATIFVADKKKI